MKKMKTLTILFYCEYFCEIREKYLTQYLTNNRFISEMVGGEDIILQTILDPLSSNYNYQYIEISTL